MKKLILPLALGLLCLWGTLAQAQNARVQVIHNSADAAADTVDIYVNAGATPAIDDLAFREATSFLTLPAGTLNVGVAPGNSTGPGDIIATVPVTLDQDSVYVITASGILPANVANYDQTVNPSIAFNLEIVDGIDTIATMANMVSIGVQHGSTDAPGVDALANGNILVDDISFPTGLSTLEVPATEYVFQITPENDNSTIVASYYVDLAPLNSQYAYVFASGFLDPAANQNGPEFGLFAALTSGAVIPLTAIGESRAQVIHNAADPNAALVDVYINTLADTIKLDDFAFRSATPFVTLPTEYELDIVIAGPTSTDITDQAIDTISATLMDGESYNIVANGVLNTANFSANPDGESTAFQLLVTNNAQETGAAGNVDLRVLHGATDAPSVGVNANGGAVVPTATYGDFTDYLSVPADEYRIDVTAANDPTTIIAPFYIDASALGGGAGVVFASGFLDPAANQNGEAFGLFAALADGSVAPLARVGNARAQVIHNSADPDAAVVDVYINTLADTIKLDDFAFREATPFVDLPTDYEIEVVIADPSSSDITDQVITTIPNTLAAGENYNLIASGVLNPANFATNPDGAGVGFALLVSAGAQETGAAGNVDLRVMHGSTDAPSVGVNANGGAVVPTATYGAFTGYLSVPAAEYRIDVTGSNDPSTIIAPFYIDASGLAGGAGVVFASGFLDPAANQNGEAFGLFAALADGSVAPLTPVGTARAQVIHNAADPGAEMVDVYINMLADTIYLDNFTFRTATPFVDLPTGYELDIVIADSTSTAIDDQDIATIPATVADGESYTIFANGVLTPGDFAPNPEAIPTAFGLFISDGAQEASANTGEVDIRVFHGATDAPAVDVLANGGTPPAVQGLSYTDFTAGYLNLPPAIYDLTVQTTDASPTVVGVYEADLTGAADGAAVVYASGFLTPGTNKDGASFTLMATFPDGMTIELPLTTSIRDLELMNEYLTISPNPARDLTRISYYQSETGDASFLLMDAQGRVVRQMAMGTKNQGQHELELNVASLSAGVYTALLLTPTSRSVRKVVVVE